MAFSIDRALLGLQNTLTTPKVGERSNIGGGLIDASSTPPAPITIRQLESVKDPLEDVETRRNLLQTILPPDGTPAVLSVATPRRELGDTYQPGGPGPFGGGHRNAGFVLTAIRENLQEKYQIYQTFDGYILYTMGRAPSIYTFSGYILKNKGSGTSQFLAFYNNSLRASAATDSGRAASISYLGSVAKGYVLSVRVGHTAERPGAAEFAFDMLLA